MPTRLWDSIRPWLLLATYLTVSLAFMLAGNQPMLRQVRSVALETSSWVEARFAWAGDFLNAVKENEMLRQENIALSSQLARAREARAENDRLRALLHVRDSSSAPLRSARVVARDITRQQNFLTIDVGAQDSVQVGMPVISESGVIGKVVFTTEHFSRVMPYLNTDFRVPGKVLASDALGIVRWEGNRLDRLLLEHVPKTESVEPGQTVVTSSASSVFPSGHLIGTIDSVGTRPGRTELRILLNPAARIGATDYVFVILSRPDPERARLQAIDPREPRAN